MSDLIIHFCMRASAFFFGASLHALCKCQVSLHRLTFRAGLIHHAMRHSHTSSNNNGQRTAEIYSAFCWFVRSLALLFPLSIFPICCRCRIAVCIPPELRCICVHPSLFMLQLCIRKIRSGYALPMPCTTHLYLY